jgi:hypothetical protein
MVRRGVDGSSPSEGSKCLQINYFCRLHKARRRRRSWRGSIGGRFASSSSLRGANQRPRGNSEGTTGQRLSIFLPTQKLGARSGGHQRGRPKSSRPLVRVSSAIPRPPLPHRRARRQRHDAAVHRHPIREESGWGRCAAAFPRFKAPGRERGQPKTPSPANPKAHRT